MNIKIKSSFLLVLLLIFSIDIKGQSQVAITIDDGPKNYKILNTLDSLNIPIGIFINEENLFQEDSIAKKELFNSWASRKYITLGNHTFSHLRYSEVGFEVFTNDIKKGEVLSKKVAAKNNKTLKYFRFPFNDLGKDSIQQKSITAYLKQSNYQITPFTVESMDWMYNEVYEYYLSKNENEKANKIGQDYVNKTLEYFSYIEAIAKEKYGRTINQIYICHDNILNAIYLPPIVHQLTLKNYKFISLSKALKDKAYKQKNTYNKKWGISWIYRWMKQEERVSYMKKEPNTEEIENLYNEIQEKKNNK